MEPKKNPNVDVGRNKTLFLEVGLIIALAVVIGAFSISQSEKVIEIPDLGLVADEIELIDVTVEEQPKPQQVRQAVNVISDILNVVKNDTQITTTFDFIDFAEDDIAITTVSVEAEEIDEDVPHVNAEVMPKFQGGDLNTFRKWVHDRLDYPEVARENNIQGKVTVQFVIERDGSLTNIEVLRTPDKLLSDETIRVLKTSPKWEPGRQRNIPVRIRYTLPIDFTLTN